MPDTVCDKFLQTATKNAQRNAVMYKRGDRWVELNWTSYREVVETIAAGLQTLGVRKGDRIAILSQSRFEWAATDLAALGLGAVVIPIYPSSTREDIAFILEDCEAKILICENPTVYNKIRDVARSTRSLERVLCFDGSSEEPSPSDYILFNDVQTKGARALKKSPTLYELAVRELQIDDIATVIYTSGTTGSPKGAVLSHVQIMSEVGDAFPLLGVTVRDRSLSFLPYAHVLGRIEIWGHALIGYTMGFAESIEKLKDNLMEVKPTLIISVPRVFEKIYAGILSQAEISPMRSKVFNWALSVGRDISKYKIDKLPVPVDLALKYQLAKKLVFNAILERLGGQLRFAVCGGAPLSQPIAEFFHSAGILILEGYGLTETTAAIAVNTPFDYRFGTVGKAVGEVKFKIADDGEILVQSKKVMKGYQKNPAATAEALTDNWFHTGDIGELSPEGYLKITDRKKDLIKTAGGKYVAPQRLEGLLKSSRFISQVYIHGDQKKYVVALLTLNASAIEEFAAENDIPPKERPNVVEHPKVKELVRKIVADANSHLASYESIKNFAILPHDFTVESGELTPSLKIKRKVVSEKYHSLLERLYGVEGFKDVERPSDQRAH